MFSNDFCLVNYTWITFRSIRPCQSSPPLCCRSASLHIMFCFFSISVWILEFIQTRSESIKSMHEKLLLWFSLTFLHLDVGKCAQSLSSTCLEQRPLSLFPTNVKYDSYLKIVDNINHQDSSFGLRFHKEWIPDVHVFHSAVISRLVAARVLTRPEHDASQPSRKSHYPDGLLFVTCWLHSLSWQSSLITSLSAS